MHERCYVRLNEWLADASNSTRAMKSHILSRGALWLLLPCGSADTGAVDRRGVNLELIRNAKIQEAEGSLPSQSVDTVDSIHEHHQGQCHLPSHQHRSTARSHRCTHLPLRLSQGNHHVVRLEEKISDVQESSKLHLAPIAAMPFVPLQQAFSWRLPQMLFVVWFLNPRDPYGAARVVTALAARTAKTAEECMLLVNGSNVVLFRGIRREGRVRREGAMAESVYPECGPVDQKILGYLHLYPRALWTLFEYETTCSCFLTPIHGVRSE